MAAFHSSRKFHYKASSVTSPTMENNNEQRV